MAVLELNRDEKQKVLENIALRAAAAAEGAQTMAGTKVKTVVLTGEDLYNVKDAILPLCGDDGRLNMYMYGDWKVVDEVQKNNDPMAILVIGTDATQSALGWNCGACGFKTCGEFNKYAKENKGRGTAQGGPCCNWQLLDFGNIVCTAAASVYAAGVPTRIHNSFGGMALACGYLEGCAQSLSITVGPWRGVGTWDEWYNRPRMKDTFTLDEFYSDMRRCYPTHFAGFNGRGKPLSKVDANWMAKGIYFGDKYDEDYEKKRIAAGAKLGQKLGEIRAKIQAQKEQKKD